jgi:DNA polymerase-3 subunit epsilon
VYERPIVMLDFETTGLSPDAGDRITEVAALRISGGRVVERFVSLVNCGARVPSFITQLTGITQAMVDAAPPAHTVVPALIDFIGDDVLAAHNASFDDKFLRAEGALLGHACRHAGPVCSLMLARRVFPGMASYKLGNLLRSLGIAFKSRAHRADADAEAAAELLLHVGRHLHQSYGLRAVDPEFLLAVNRLAAAKVHGYITRYADERRASA